MKESRKDAWLRLYEIAVRQHSYFTPRQAVWAGIDRTLHGYHLRVGNWNYGGRGIYSLPLIPPSPNSLLKRWELWSADRAGNTQAVFSHQTALALHGVAATRPPKIQMTVPRSFRRSGPMPSRLHLHYTDLPKSAIVEVDGLRCTSPLRTILDVAALDRIPKAVLSRAMLNFLERSEITPREIQHTRMTPSTRALFKKIYPNLESRS